MPLLTLDEKHIWRLDDRVIPGVTEVLRAVGVVETGWYTEAGRRRGELVHRACKQLALGQLDWSGLADEIAGYVCSLDALLVTTKAEVVLVEEPVHTDEYAGQLDLVLRLNGELVLPDEKSGAVPTWCKLQTAAYAKALKHSHGLDVKKRFGIRLKADGSCGILTNAYTDLSDTDYWDACLLIYQGKRSGWAPIVTHRPASNRAQSGESGLLVAPASALDHTSSTGHFPTSQPSSAEAGTGSRAALAGSTPAEPTSVATLVLDEPALAELRANADRPPLPEEIVVQPDAVERQNLTDWILHIFKKRWPRTAHGWKEKLQAAMERHWACKSWIEVTKLPLGALKAGLESLKDEMVE